MNFFSNLIPGTLWVYKNKYFNLTFMVIKKFENHKNSNYKCLILSNDRYYKFGELVYFHGPEMNQEKDSFECL